jgi:hypothetical protein
MTAGDLRCDRWDAASYRCPCGFAGDDVGEFERHLDAAAGAGLEHFEVLEGWTLEQVRRWQAAAGAPGKPGAAPVARWLLPLGPAWTGPGNLLVAVSVMGVTVRCSGSSVLG